MISAIPLASHKIHIKTSAVETNKQNDSSVHINLLKLNWMVIKIGKTNI